MNRRVAAGVATAGTTAGILSALSTIGSVAGSLLRALHLMLAIGRARTTYLFTGFLIVVGLIGLRDWRFGVMLLVVTLLALLKRTQPLHLFENNKRKVCGFTLSSFCSWSGGTAIAAAGGAALV